MGVGKVISAVVDAGPLIHLAEIDSLPLLSLFETLHVPDAVWSEAVEKGSVPFEFISSLLNVKRHSLDRTAIAVFVEQNKLDDLHSGEIECLFLCRQAAISTLFTDDMTVRDTARNLSIVPVGSLGIIVKACREGIISLAEAEQRIIALYDVSSLFVTKTIVELALKQLRSLE